MNWIKAERIAKLVAVCVIALSLLIIAIVGVSYRVRKPDAPTKHYQFLKKDRHCHNSALFDPQTGNLYLRSKDYYNYKRWKLITSFPPKDEKAATTPDKP